MNKWAVIGAGNGGQATAAHLALKGYDVVLYDIDQQTVDEINNVGGITLHGAIEGFGRLLFASTDMQKVMESADIIMIVLPAIYLTSIAEKCAPYIKNEHIIMLHPGSTFGPIAFRQAAENAGCRADYLLGGTSTLLYACRIIKNGEVNVFGVKDVISGAALPASRSGELKDAINEAFPQIGYLSNVIEVGLENMNGITHPAPALLNTARIDAKEDFDYYKDGFTPAVAGFAEQIDAERVLIGKALGLDLLDVKQCYFKEYSIKGDTLYNIIQACSFYDGLKAPKDIRNRFLLEDIPFTLVPFKALADMAGVNVPGISALITIAKMLLGETLHKGFTAEQLGFNSFSSVQELLKST